MLTEAERLSDRLDDVEGGLLNLLAAVKAGDPRDEIIWRIQEELRLIRITHSQSLAETKRSTPKPRSP